MNLISELLSVNKEQEKQFIDTNMKSDIEELIKRCDKCASYQNKLPAEPLSSVAAECAYTSTCRALLFPSAATHCPQSATS